MCFIFMPPLPSWSERLTVEDLKNLPTTSIITLVDVVRCYESLVNSRFYKIKIVITLRDGKVKIIVLTIGLDGRILQHGDGWSIEKENCPVFFIRQLEQAKAKEQLIEGHPAAIIEFPKNVRDEILRRANGKNEI